MEATRSQPANEPLAIIGIGCRFPGGVRDAASYWKLLCDGVDAISEVPPDRWSIDRYFHPESDRPGKTTSRWGGFIDGFDQFDAAFFGISPREAGQMDPQQRLLLEVAFESLEDAGQPFSDLVGTEVAVFMGLSSFDYSTMQTDFRDRAHIDVYTNTGTALSIAANRISYCFDLLGPSAAVDTACSSSLVAVHLACQSLWRGESSLALAGGVNVLICPDGYVGFSKMSMLSPDGRCRAFDARANGFVRGEGAGIVVLKPLSRARADGDRIYALIRSTAVNQDGHSSGMTAPSEAAQEALLRQACRAAGVAPADIQYVEAHGTGTPVGDPIEARAIGAALGTGRRPDQPCVIGSVKSNFGHLEPASGIAGLIKTALALQHRTIPASLHIDVPNPAIPFADLHLRPARTHEPWPDQDGPLLAGVNSFGFGGTNAHAILQGVADDNCWPRANGGLGKSEAYDAGVPFLIALSARSPEALCEVATACRDMVMRGDVSLQDLAHTAGLRRGHHDHRLAVAVRSAAEFDQKIATFLAGEAASGLTCARAVPADERKLAFIYCGQGPQWWAMGRQLLACEPVFRDMVERCDGLLKDVVGWSVLRELTADESRSRLHETAIAQPAIFAVQVALTELWRSWGIEPGAVVGHSVGEVAAAHTAGALTLEDAIRVIGERGRCMELAPARGGMLAVGMPPDDVESVLNGFTDSVAVAAVNGPASLTLSGPTEALADIARRLDARDIFQRSLRVNYAFHSPGLEPVREELVCALRDIKPRQASHPLYSTVSGQLIEGHELDAEYWWRNLRQPVRFLDAANRLIEAGCTVAVEIGPHPVLASSLADCCAHASYKMKVVPSLRRQEDEAKCARQSLGALYALGHCVDWERVNGPGRFIALPSYPWQRQRYWHEKEDLRQRRIGRPDNPFLGQALGTPEPSWETQLDLYKYRWLGDHRVRARAVFPGVGYVELALAAAAALRPEATHVLEDVHFPETCLLSENQATVLQTTLHLEDGSFSIHGRRPGTPGTSGQWTLHARGTLRSRSRTRPPTPVQLADIWDRCPVEVPRADCYRRFHEQGLDYGLSFQGIDQLWRGEDECLARIDIREGVRGLPSTAPLHPATMDACLHVVLGAAKAMGGDSLYLPVQIAEVRVHGCSGDTLWSHGRIVEKGRGYLVADVRVFEESGQVVWEALGLRCQLVGSGHDRTNPGDDLLYESKWELRPLADLPTPRADADLPSPAQLTESLQNTARNWQKEENLSQRYARFLAESSRLCALYAWSALHELGADMQPGQRFDLESLIARLRIAPQHRRLLARCVGWLTEEGFLDSFPGSIWERTSLEALPPDRRRREAGARGSDTSVLWRETLARQASFSAELVLIDRVGRNLAGVLRGEVDPLQLIFPEASLSAAEHLYQDSDIWRFYNLVTREALLGIVERLPEGRTLRVLEIGAGTGAMAAYLLPILPADRTAYVFTDLSSHFLSHAEQKFRAYPFVHYQKLDIEQDPVAQGFAPHSFDVVIASQVLHATARLRESLQRVRQLLASSGWLLVQEFVRPTRWLEMVFGTLEGWWRFADVDIRREHPILDWPGWQALLAQEGFDDVAELSASREHLGNTLLAARGPRIESPRTEAAWAPRASAGCWLLLADRYGVAGSLARQLEARGEQCVLVHAGTRFRHCEEYRFELDPGSPGDFEILLAKLKESSRPPTTIVHCWSLDGPAPEVLSAAALEDAQLPGCLSVVNLVQACMSRLDEGARLVLVTRRSQAVRHVDDVVAPDQAILWGLGRVIVNEAPRFRCRRIDLGGVDLDAEIQALLDELWTESEDDEVSLRGRGRYVHRYVRSDEERLSAATSVHTESYRLEVSPAATLDGLTLRAAERRPPAAGQIEIEAKAAGLNFSDVMKALGLYPDLPDGPVPLGLECSGKVTAVGAAVADFQVGDEVVALAPFSLGKHVLAQSGFVAHKPASLSHDEAATIPVAFLTAQHALHRMGRMEAGERVLIHSATGGVGLAAMQLARAARAEVFATAGTAEKRDFLRALGIEHVMDSRSLAFADEVRERTGGRGVDLVLNSLAGEAIAAGLSVLAEHGRFLELGKSDVYRNSKLGMYTLRRNISLIVIDLMSALREVSPRAAADFQHVVALVRSGELSALPHRVFTLDGMRDAFRFMSQGKHIGKVVLSFRDRPRRLAPSSEPAPVICDRAAYLITGGLGGFGLATARWLADQGARHIALMGRSGAASADAEQAVADLEQAGVQVKVIHGDVSRQADVARALAELGASMPPLRGVIHAAMVLDDCLLENLTAESWLRVLRPKVIGAWNLHCLTRELPLDFMVLYSSMATVFGTPGQANYSAANAFLDALAHYRRAQGLPALAIDWGYVGEVGYVARHEQMGERFASWGARQVSPRDGLALLGRLLQHQAVHAGILGVDWERLRPLGGSAEDVPARFRDLCAAARGRLAAPTSERDGVPLRTQLLALPANERGGVLEAAVRDKVARALGAAAARLDVHQPIAGIDSLVGVELRNWIEEELRVTIPIARLTKGPSVAELTEMIRQQLEGAAQADGAQADGAQTGDAQAGGTPELVERN